VNISIFIGYKQRGVWGAFLSTLGACLPSFIIILLIAFAFMQFRDNPWVEKFFKGLRPAVVALIASPVFRMAKSSHINRYNIWIPILSAFAIWLIGVSPIYIILIAGISGYAYGQYLKD
jgi:chromate transporter